MSRVSPELLQKLKDAVNLVEVASEHVVLRKTGNNYVGLCPFHNERSPSFGISEQKQVFFCQGCKEGGDLIGFIMKLHGLSFPEALEDLAARAKIALPKDWGGASDDPEKQQKRDERNEKLQTAFKLNRFAAAFYHSKLRSERHIAQYFHDRGIQSQEMMRNFYLGAAPAGWDALARHLVDKKAPLDLACELGLIRPSNKAAGKGVAGPGYFDLFRNRALFPILDTRGRVVAFGGRSVPPPEGAPDTGSDGPKYLNSSDSILFHKSKVLYGLFQAGKHIRASDEVLIVEGYFDVLALHAAGFQNAVATCGTALTRDHLQILRRFGQKIVLLFDGDRAGREATDRAMEVGLEEGLVLHAAELPDGRDPDEVLFDPETGKPLERGILQMREILARGSPLLDRRMAEAAADARKGPEERTQAVKRVGAWLSRFQDPVGREVRLSQAERDLGVGRELLLGRGEPRPGGARVTQAPAPPAAARAPSRPSMPRPAARPPASQRRVGLSSAEKLWIQLLAHPEVASRWVEKLSPELPPGVTFPALFSYPPARDFLALLFSVPAGLQAIRAEPARFLGGETDAELRSALAAVLTRDSPVPADEEIQMASHRLLTRAWVQISQEIEQRLAAAEAQKNMGLHAELSKEYLDVERRIQEFRRLYDEA